MLTYQMLVQPGQLGFAAERAVETFRTPVEASEKDMSPGML